MSDPTVQVNYIGLGDLIEAQKHKSFTDPRMAEDEDALGILIANHLEWDGAAILKVASYALTDGNFHTEATAVDHLLERLLKDMP